MRESIQKLLPSLIAFNTAGNLCASDENKFLNVLINLLYNALDAIQENGYVVPFGDGPNPIYTENVGKNVIINILNQAKDYVYITTPYLITDNEVIKTIKNTALRGIDVRIITPHIPDKKMVFELTRSNYDILMNSGVNIYEYEPGFIHAKSYISDDIIGMIGTINLDYWSLTHHFENGVWIYNDKIIKEMNLDFINTANKSILINENPIKTSKFRKLLRSILKIFSPMF